MTHTENVVTKILSQLRCANEGRGIGKDEA